jgi:hypothetical protein
MDQSRFLWLFEVFGTLHRLCPVVYPGGQSKLERDIPPVFVLSKNMDE